MERMRSVTTGVITLAVLVFLYVPLAIVVLFSFHKTGGLSFPFRGFSTQWYRQVFSSEEFVSALQNSAVVATSVAAVTLVLGTAASYAITRMRGGFRPFLVVLVFLPITLPGLFLGLSLLVFLVRVGFQLSLVTVAIGHFVYVLPYFMLIACAALSRLDPALEESAADLGCSPWDVFWRVTLPQIWPLLVGAAVLAFALSFDEFIITFFVIGPDSTLPLYIWSSLRRTVSPSINVVSTLLLAITLVGWAVAFLFILRGEILRQRAPRPEVRAA
jgi:spermidine/putrescine transport system permease protein